VAVVLALARGAVALAAAAGAASADGLTAAQLQAAGWTCVLPAGETNLHCRNPASEPLRAGPTEVTFLEFDPSVAAFLEIEHVIRADLYHGQPCNGTTAEYQFLPIGPGYYSSHDLTRP